MQSYRSVNTCVSHAYIFTESVTEEAKVVFCNFSLHFQLLGTFWKG